MTCSSHRLTEDERLRWVRDGYLIIREALSPQDVAQYTRAVDELYEQNVGPGESADPKKGMSWRNLFEHNDLFIKLVDHPGAFGLVLDLLGSYIQCTVTQAIVRPVDPEYRGYIHPDGGEALEKIRVSESSLQLQVKVMYFLTDLLEPNMGNFVVFPGSHLRPWPKERLPAGSDTPGAAQLCGAAGDAVIFPHALWHGPGKNLSGKVRKTLVYRYNQLFMRPWDYEEVSPEVLAKCTPRQRRLLGDMGAPWRPGAYYRRPTPAEQEALMEGTSA